MVKVRVNGGVWPRFGQHHGGEAEQEEDGEEGHTASQQEMGLRLLKECFMCFCNDRWKEVHGFSSSDTCITNQRQISGNSFNTTLSFCIFLANMLKRNPCTQYIFKHC